MLPSGFRTATFLLVLCAAAQAFAQARVNPDISAIGDMRYIYRDDVARALAGTKSTSFEFTEAELNFSGYLNPYARADVYVGIHGVTGPVELEEVYVSVVRGVPLGLQFRFGKYFSNFSRILAQHPHQFSWLERPLMHKSVFGPDGAPLIGGRVTRLIGIGETALTLSADAFRSDFFEAHEGADTTATVDAGHTHGAVAAEYDIGFSGRAAIFRELSDVLWLDLGGSYMWAQYDPHHGLYTNLYGFDAKLKWRPDVYKGFDLMAEVQHSNREVEDQSTEQVSKVDSFGAFAAAELKFRRRFDVGSFYDFAQDPNAKDFETTGTGAWIAFMPAEETARFSLVYRYETSDFYAGASNSLTFQVLFSLGPHKPHAF